MTKSTNNQKVTVGMSGGVDSSVSTVLLKKQGYEVSAAFMKNWSGEEFGIEDQCPWEEDQEVAQTVSSKLKVPFRSYNFEKEYRESVVEYFFSEFGKGRTPNPDVMCNKTIKFDAFLQRALADGADKIATGHYAQIRETSGGFELVKGADPGKDQTYFLHTFTQEQLSKVIFPIGHLQKSEVRKLAHTFQLPNASRPDSQGICFIGEIDVYKFLRSQLPESRGEIRDIDSEEVIGEHDGVAFYTIGQRQGLHLGGNAVPYYVADKDLDKNIIYVAMGSQHSSLFKTEVKLENLHLINPNMQEQVANNEIPLQASIRYRQAAQPGVIDLDSLTFIFEQPQRAITSGQSLVLYSADVCLGGGVIV